MTEKEAMFWRKEGSLIVCELCNHKCKIANGKRGICGVREHIDGKLYSCVYGKTTGAHADPIEKKPLYHFYPGSFVYSLGTIGCNFRCKQCQNYEISQRLIDEKYLLTIDEESVVSSAKDAGCKGLAWTYNEPTVWYEFTLNTSKIAKKEGLYTVYVTNGYIAEEPLKTLAPHLDAMNIDVKGFSEDFYKNIEGARLGPVLETCILAYKLGIHIELTYLIIPTLNDSEEMFQKFATWVKEKLSVDTVVHFSRFHPDYKLLDLPPTPYETMNKAYKIAKDTGIKYVYLGNLSSDKENTFCPKCGKCIIERRGFHSKWINAKDCVCSCGEKIPIVKTCKKL